MSADHEYFENLILRLPDGDLSGGEKEQLQGHLSSCADCRRLFFSVRSVTETLDDDASQPPEGFAADVMDRILAAEAERFPAPGFDMERRTKSARRRRRRGAAAFLGMAAVFVLVIGGGVYLSRGLLGHVSSSSETVLQQSAVMEAAERTQTAAAAAPRAAVSNSAAAEEAALEAEEAVLDADAVPAAGAADTGYTWENPAPVPAGRESDFEALLETARWDDGLPTSSFHVFTAVEYRGVIYEFLTNDDGEYLLWRDAAEGVTLNRSTGTVAELMDLIG